MSIYKFVAAQRDSYRSDTIEITEGYDFSQYETSALSSSTTTTAS